MIPQLRFITPDNGKMASVMVSERLTGLTGTIILAIFIKTIKMAGEYNYKLLSRANTEVFF